MSRADSEQPPTTSLTLLGRLRDPADAEAWREFDGRYRDLLVGFLLRRGLQIADAEDTAQATILRLVTGLRSFDYDVKKAGFRAYLYRSARSTLSDWYSRQKRGPSLVSTDGLDANDESALQAAFEREWVDHHYRLALRQYRAETDRRGLEVLEATIAGRPPRVIAEELGMTEAAVYKSQQRLRDRLRTLIAAQVRDEELPK